MAMAFEQMSIWKIIGRAVALYCQSFLKYIALAAVVLVPYQMVELLLRFIRPGFGQGFGLGLLYGLLSLVISELALNVVTAAMSRQLCGDESVSQSYRGVLRRLSPLIALTVMVALAVGVGLLLLIIPGIIVMLLFSLATPVMMLEGRNAVESIKRSRLLVLGNLGRVLLLNLVLCVLCLIPYFALNRLGQWTWLAVGQGSLVAGHFISCVSALMLGLLAGPLSALTTVLLYHDLRIRKERRELQMCASDGASGETPQSA